MNILRLKEVIKERGLTGKELAERVDVSPNSISNIVKGNSFPSPPLLISIAKVLDVDVRELFIPTKEHNDPKDEISDIINRLAHLKDKI